MEIEITCPLGSKCEEIRDNKLYRCAWYTHIVGKDPQSEAQVDSWKCAIAFMPMLQVEMSQTNRGQTQAMNSFRDEMVKTTNQSNMLNQAFLTLTADERGPGNGV